ncbi:MAG: hypothetical protein ACRDL0_04865, partial [Thermoleophilaceae bacterium]
MGRGSGPSPLVERLRAAGARIRDALWYLGDDVADGLRSAGARAGAFGEAARDELGWWREAIGERLAGRRIAVARPARGSARIASLSALLLAVVLVGGVLAGLPGGDDDPGEPDERRTSTRPAAPAGSSSEPADQVVERDAGAIAGALATGGRGVKPARGRGLQRHLAPAVLRRPGGRDGAAGK